MDTERVLGLIAAVYGVAMGLSPALQIRRILRLRSSRDVSLGYLGVITFGFLIWMAYAVAIDRPALLIPNSVAFVVGTATIVVALRFRDPPDRTAMPGQERAGREA